MNRQEITSTMYAYIMRNWEELPDENKRALGFDCVRGSKGEEQALRQLGRLFIEYVELSFSRAATGAKAWRYLRRSGFSREGGSSDDKFPSNVLASSRLKPLLRFLQRPGVLSSKYVFFDNCL